MLTLPEFVGIDLDGTILDTDLLDPRTAIGKETLSILDDMFGKGLIYPERFKYFYANASVAINGLPGNKGSEILYELITKEFSEFDLNSTFIETVFSSDSIETKRNQFIAYRNRKRWTTYAKEVSFIGSEKDNSGTWIERSPVPKEHHYLITSTVMERLEWIKKNPQITIDGLPILDYFDSRRVTGNETAWGKTIKNGKPNPEPYEVALHHADPNANDSGIIGIAIEDSTHGLRSAHDARYNGARLFVVKLDLESNMRGPIQADNADYIAPCLATIDHLHLFRAAGYNI